MSMSIGLGIGIGKRRGGSSLPETRALVARMTTKPVAARAGLIDNLIKALKAAGVWSQLDALYVMAAADAQAAKLNWITGTYDLTAVSAPTFTVDRGYAGDGAASYLDTGFNPITAPSPKFTQNSGSLILWSRTNLPNGADNSGDFGRENSRIGRFLSTSGMAMGRINMASTLNSMAAGAYPGMISWSRTGSAAWTSYAAGVAVNSGTEASAALTNGTLRICSWTAGSFGVNQLAAAAIGASLNGTQHAAVKAALQTYLTAIGAA
ncbi:MAG: hypothetical protein J0H11_14970 [Rhizobiales bacterium]|nr:hypothetical protein [Hyphomicrobiales bacterium]